MKYIYLIFLLLIFGCNEQTKKQNGTFNDKMGRIPTASPSDLGLNDSLFDAITLKIKEQYYPNIHSLLIAKKGQLIYEQYFSGRDEVFGEDLGIVKHNDSVLHDVRSISKSIVSTMVGICIDQGLIEGVDQKISEFYPEHEFEGYKANWTIEHFLTMTTGLVWNEHDIPYTNENNDELKMIISEDPIQYVLSKPLDTIPGTKWYYCGGATQVLANIVEKVSNKSILEFTQEHLFIPLGIERFGWTKMSKDGGSDNYSASAGLKLTSRGLLKIGLLYRNNGSYNEKQVVSKSWVSRSFSPYIDFELKGYECGYGYQFWMWSNESMGRRVYWVVAAGNGDQYIYWDFENDLIIVTTAGNYNNYDPETNVEVLLMEYVYPAFFGNEKK